MAHNRRLGLAGVSLTKARVKIYDLEVMEKVGAALEKDIVASNFLEGAPFDSVFVSLRYGLKSEEKPHYLGIHKKDKDLGLAIELDTHDLVEADRDGMKRLFETAVLKALIHAGRKYERPIQVLEERLARLQQGAGNPGPRCAR